ncbi:MAG: Ig-like domain-containing protein [Acidobacteriota bacterium]
MRGLDCRGLRLELVAGLALALALPVLPVSAAHALAAASEATQTTLNVETHDQSGRTKATASVKVTGTDGNPASGSVAIDDGTRQLGSVFLNAQGQATTVIDLPGGKHSLTAVYSGSTAYQKSVSAAANVQGQVTTTPDFQVSVTPLVPSNTLSPGGSATATVTITPENNAALPSPMFISLSCSGLPDQSTCTFSPQNVEILANTPVTCPAGSPATACPPTSSMVIQTQAEGQAMAVPPAGVGGHGNPVAWALLFPGILGLGGLAWGTRRRRWLNRLVLVALLGLVTTLGATACNPQYYYYNHGPPNTPPTPAGSFTVYVTGQSTNGVTAITHSTTLTLTVK